MSSNVHTALSRNDWHPDLVHDLPSQSLQARSKHRRPGERYRTRPAVRRFASFG